jgi:hypothetical protein
MGKVSIEGGSSHTEVTKEFAEKRKLKKVSVRVPVIGFGSPAVEVGVVNEVPSRPVERGASR